MVSGLHTSSISHIILPIGRINIENWVRHVERRGAKFSLIPVLRIIVVWSSVTQCCGKCVCGSSSLLHKWFLACAVGVESLLTSHLKLHHII